MRIVLLVLISTLSVTGYAQDSVNDATPCKVNLGELKAIRASVMVGWGNDFDLRFRLREATAPINKGSEDSVLEKSSKELLIYIDSVTENIFNNQSVDAKTVRLIDALMNDCQNQ